MTEAHGWRLHGHPLLLNQLKRLEQAIRPAGPHVLPFKQAPSVRLWSALHGLMFEHIPRDPLRQEFRQPEAFWSTIHHWWCARLGGNRFGLFFQVDVRHRSIVYAWVADRERIGSIAPSGSAHVLLGRASSVTEKGEVLLPTMVRDALGIRRGARVGFGRHGNAILLGDPGVSMASPARTVATPRLDVTARQPQDFPRARRLAGASSAWPNLAPHAG